MAGSGDDAKANKGSLTPRAEDFPRWYQEVVARAELAENGPVRGTMVIRPWGFAIWELLQATLDRRIKEAGAENVYFPLFIPESYLRLEAEHVEGFSPELAVVTHAGGKELEEPIVVRPTSETVINSFFAKWIQSHRDLPLLINQWSNVVRWELRPRLLLRTTEFLWQEGHTAHASEPEARQYALRILEDVYRATMQEQGALPVLVGHKTARERFAGAIRTWACEAMMGDGKALQMGTSHELGQNFAKVFSIQYSNDQGALDYVWQTSWGVSTRLIGAFVMAHGDDFGLRLPPALAPTQVVVVVARDGEGVLEAANALASELGAAGHRTRVDARTDIGFGRRSVDWELKGVPVRVEVGPRDLEAGLITLVSRHERAKSSVSLAGAVAEVGALLARAERDLYEEAAKSLAARTTDTDSLDDAIEAAKTGFTRVPMAALGDAGEDRLNEAALSIRCIQRSDGSLAADDDERDLVAVVARAY